ncbi:DUF2845 domain-containing protein [Pseudomonas baltica]|uniref:DUF2845 domain-containing protein n=1 Tax=Pseudomonas baltica TaxID=2762576 RepID=UPI00289D122F|nr:DUF2845 domain-containing protein [Pseudomonas baltica]
MRQAKDVLSILAAAMLLTTQQADAGSMRCGTALVSEDTPMAEVLEKCGPPARQDSEGPVARPKTNNGYWNSAKISIWVYGPDGGAYQYLRFVDERLVSIEMSRKAPGQNLFTRE